jgi:hypothetical protein
MNTVTLTFNKHAISTIIVSIKYNTRNMDIIRVKTKHILHLWDEDMHFNSLTVLKGYFLYLLENYKSIQPSIEDVEIAAYQGAKADAQSADYERH